MSEYDDILNSDKEWAEKFHSMKVTGKCDSGCGKDATTWFGNTSAATCGSSACIEKQQESYDSHCTDCSCNCDDE